eukprot:361293-Chlamydomonas_euryale.AAC.4
MSACSSPRACPLPPERRCVKYMSFTASAHPTRPSSAARASSTSSDSCACRRSMHAIWTSARLSAAGTQWMTPRCGR